MARPEVARIRFEYQDRINFVILDFDLEADHALAQRLGIAAHPAYAIVEPGSAEAARKWFGPTIEEGLRERIDAALTSDATPNRG